MQLEQVTPEDIGLWPCPAPGEGCHAWMYAAARTWVRAGADDDTISEWIRFYLRRAEQPNEIKNTLRKVRRELEGAEPERETFRKRYPIDRVRIEALTSFGPTPVGEIMARSPIDPRAASAGDALRALFAPDEKTIVFTNERGQGELVWQHGIEDQRLEAVTRINKAGAWFLLNPVTGDFVSADNVWGKTRRSRGNTTAFKHVLIESDQLEVGFWLTILKQQELPIVSITLSGNASAHAIVRLRSMDHDSWIRETTHLAASLVPLGACSGSLTPVRLTRLPGVMRRDNGNEQTLLWLNPEPRAIPIQQMPPLR